jgi:stage III sporulation protein AG
MLSISQSEKTIYQTDSTYSQSDDHADSRTQTILISDNQRNETGLVHQKHSPVYQGAIVLAEGADLASVKLAIVDAVSDITGLGADKISVLKMK